MPLGERDRGIIRERAQRPGLAGARHRLGEPAAVDRTARTVEDHAGHLEVGIEALEAEHNGGGAPRKRPGVNDQHHRRGQPLGNLRRGAVFAEPVGAVETTHDALNEGEIGLRGALADAGHDLLTPAHPTIEVIGGPAGGQRVIGRIDEVRAHLESLHCEPAATQRLEQPQRHRGFAHTTRNAGNDKNRHLPRSAHPGRGGRCLIARARCGGPRW